MKICHIEDASHKIRNAKIAQLGRFLIRPNPNGVGIFLYRAQPSSNNGFLSFKYSYNTITLQRVGWLQVQV